MSKTYNILEVANTHGGNVDYILDLMEEFKEFHKKRDLELNFNHLNIVR